MEKIKHFLLDIFFPKFCLNCQKEGSLLCEDCEALLETCEDQYCLCDRPKRICKTMGCSACQTKKLNGLYFATNYQNSLVKNLIQKFKYEPFIKELAKPLASLIITHFNLLNNKPDFSRFVLIPIPASKKRLKWRGYNQAEELTKELSKNLGIPLVLNCLIKTKEVLPQVELSAEDRKESTKGIFDCQNKNEIRWRKILLVDDVYTTGATMEEAARILKESGATEVWGAAVARE